MSVGIVTNQESLQSQAQVTSSNQELKASRPDLAVANERVTAKEGATKLSNTSEILAKKEQDEEEKEQNPAYVKEVSQEEIAKKADELIAELTAKDLGLSFSVDKDLDRTLISVMDRATDDVIRQIPSEEFMRMARSMQKLRDGTLVGPEAHAVLERRPKAEMKGILFDHLA